MKKARNIIYNALQLFCILIVGCSSNAAPRQVHGSLRFGPYTISPPAGCWYFQREYPKSFKLPVKTSKDFFLESFFENKDMLLNKHNIRNGVFIDFAVYKNIYKSFDEYRTIAKKYDPGFSYEELPKEAQVLKNMPNWNCKQTNWGVYGLQCIALRKDQVVIGIFGDKKRVLSKIPEFKTMVDSMEYIKHRTKKGS